METKVRLHAPQGYVWNDSNCKEKDNKEVLTLEVGNVTVDSGITVSLSARRGSKNVRHNYIIITSSTKPSCLPTCRVELIC